MTPTIGDTLTLQLDGLGVDVRVLELRSSFGRTDARVTPIAGDGERWVHAGKLKAKRNEKKGGK